MTAGIDNGAKKAAVLNLKTARLERPQRAESAFYPNLHSKTPFYKHA